MTTGTTCTSIYYVYYTSTSTAYYITLTNGKSVNDALFEMLGFERVQKLMERNVIEIAPLAYMRGRTLDNAFIILDEAQNFAPKLSSKVLPDGKIVSPPIDDMFPFLDRAEYQANKLQ